MRPNPLALLPLAAPVASIVAREAVAALSSEGFDQHPVGTGPFRIKTLSRRGVTVLAKNPHYHQTYPTSGRTGRPHIRAHRTTPANACRCSTKCSLPLIEETQPAMLKFMFGQLDWVAMDRDNFVNLAYKDATGFHLRPEQASKYRIYSEPTLATTTS